MSTPGEQMQERAQRRTAAAREMREIAKQYAPTACSCKHCSLAHHIRADLRKIAGEHSDPLVTGSGLWIAWRDHQKAAGNWPLR